MKKLLCLITIILAVCVQSISLYANEHALADESAPGRTYAIDILAQKTKLKFYIENCNQENADIIISSYQKWFKNTLNLIKEENTDITDYKDIIKFGADETSYICTADPKEADINFYFVYKNEYEKYYGPTNSAGVFKFRDGKMLVAVRKDNINVRENKVLIHEIGHSLRMQDLYDGQFYDDSGDYGSGAQWSIMHHSDTLTCDDADAILNVLYLTKKLAGKNPADLTFNSLCRWRADSSYKNARLTNRPPLVIDYKGHRTVYTYCKDGKPHNIIKINPSNYDKLYDELQAPLNCDYTPLPEPRIDAAKGYYTANFKTGKIYPLKGAELFTEKNILMSLPGSGGFLLQVSTDGKVPGYIKITDETDTVIYAMAYLYEGYNFVYDAYIAGKSKFYPTMFVYNRKDPSKNYLYTPNDKEKAICKAEALECKEMETLLNKTLPLIKSSSRIILPRHSGWGYYSQRQHIANAQSWENYLLKNFPPLSISAEKFNKKLLKQLKTLSPEQIKLKMPTK
ncbi:MAG: hypothetical protein PUB86_02640 [Elusimicrobia bacterium]|nr:hypothetical protein [Elusimicrobiota bacterium]